MDPKKTPEAEASEDDEALLETQDEESEPETATSELEDDADGEEEGESGTETDDESSDEPEDDKPEDDKPTKSKLRRERQKEKIRELVRAADDANARAAAAERALQDFKDDVGDPPKEDDYENPAEYAAAKAVYDADVRAVKRARGTLESNAKTARTEASKTALDTFRERAMALADRYPDIEAKVFQDNSLPISPDMAEIIMASEQGPELAYYLASHREEASRIKQMKPLAAAKELGRIEARLGIPQARTETKAPKPTPALNGKAGRVSKDPRQMTDAEYFKWRQSGGGE